MSVTVAVNLADDPGTNEMLDGEILVEVVKAPKSTTLLLSPSKTQRSPELSKTTPPGLQRVFLRAPQEEATKVCCPMTREAAIPVLKGALNSRTRLLSWSEAHRFP